MPSRNLTVARTVAAAFVMAAGVVGGCDRSPPAERPEDAASGPRYFGDTAFVGRTVAINAPVIRVINERSFEVDARTFGDDSVLVITPRSLPVVAGDRLPLLGRVEVFDYATYSREYRLAGRQEYAEFVGEEFLTAADAGPPGLPGTPTASATAFRAGPQLRAPSATGRSAPGVITQQIHVSPVTTRDRPLAAPAGGKPASSPAGPKR
jgi:hypothetical protein